jgi:hypothetical protein
LIREAGLKSLEEAGEPQHTLHIYGAGMANLAQAGYPVNDSQMEDAGEYFSQLLVDFEENIAYRQGFLHYPIIESWWHQEMAFSPPTLSDQVEIKLVQILLENNQSVEETKLVQEIYNAFPGPITPRFSLIEACLRSYAEGVPGQPQLWKLRKSDRPANRVQDLREMEEIITSIGIDLGYRSSKGEAPENLSLVIWDDSGGDPERFYISASGLLSKIVKSDLKDMKKGWIVLPGSRAGLVHFKMRQNPVLGEIIEKDWRFIKYRHLRRLHGQSGLTQENIEERFSLDPFTSDSPQIPLI